MLNVRGDLSTFFLGNATFISYYILVTSLEHFIFLLDVISVIRAFIYFQLNQFYWKPPETYQVQSVFFIFKL